MWTYLVLLTSIFVIFLVFARRIVLFLRKNSDVGTAPAPLSGTQELEESRPKVERISKVNREKVEALCKRGEAMINAGKDEEAIKCFVQALAIDCVHLETQHKLAMLYLQKQMYGAAAALFKELAAATQDPVHYSHLGLALYQQSDYEQAKIAYQTALTLDPSRPQRFVSLSQVYKAMGQIQNSIISLNKAIEIDAENLEYLFLLADLQVELGEIAKAKEIIQKLLVSDPKNKEAKAILREIKKMEEPQ